MATIVVRDVPDQLHERLKALAASAHRSMNGQVLEILKRAAEVSMGVMVTVECDVCGQVYVCGSVDSEFSTLVQPNGQRLLACGSCVKAMPWKAA